MRPSDALGLIIIAIGIVAWPAFRPFGAALLILAAGFLGYGILTSLRAIADATMRTRAERPVPFSVEDIEKQERAILQAWEKARTLTESINERVAEGTFKDIEERTRLHREYADAEKKANREVRQLDLMVQANAKVLAGVELRAEARSRVIKTYHHALQQDVEDMIAQVRAEKASLPERPTDTIPSPK